MIGKFVSWLHQFNMEGDGGSVELIVFLLLPYAVWLPGPIFERMASEYPGVEFFKVDVDDAEDVAAKCGIQAMPTFQVFKDGARVDEMRGASEPGLKALLDKHQ